jgi:hypothetical protein
MKFTSLINIAPCAPNTWSHPCLYPHRAQRRSRRGSKIRIPPCFQYTQHTYISAALNAAPKWTPCNSKSNKTSHRLHRPRAGRLGRAKQSLPPPPPLNLSQIRAKSAHRHGSRLRRRRRAARPPHGPRCALRDRYSSLPPSARVVCLWSSNLVSGFCESWPSSFLLLFPGSEVCLVLNADCRVLCLNFLQPRRRSRRRSRYGGSSSVLLVLAVSIFLSRLGYIIS